MRYAVNTPDNIRGLSIVELMIALTIGLVILVAVTTLLVNSKRAYTTQDRLARVQENGRFAMQFLIKDLRLAGYYGCSNDITSINNTLDTSDPSKFYPFNAAYPLEGLEAAGGAWYPSNSTTMPSKPVKAGTDAVAIRKLDPSSSFSLVKEMPNESAVLFLDSASGLKDGDVVMVSDCSSGDLFQITNIQDGSGVNSGKKGVVHNPGGGDPGNATQELSKSYSPPGASIMKFTSSKYFISTGAGGGPALFREDETVTPPVAEELVEGIESLQILYGKDTDGDKMPNIYLKAGASGLETESDWNSVVSVRVGVLAVTTNQEDAETDSASYDVDKDGTDDLIAPGDRNKRRVFLSTVVMRNMQ